MEETPKPFCGNSLTSRGFVEEHFASEERLMRSYATSSLIGTLASIGTHACCSSMFIRGGRELSTGPNQSEPHLMCADLMKLIIKGGGNTHEETVANLEDISPSGACVQLETAIRMGTDVEIVCDSGRLKGKVRYCRFVELGYDVGSSSTSAGREAATVFCRSICSN
jgi:hypothetical protein